MNDQPKALPEVKKEEETRIASKETFSEKPKEEAKTALHLIFLKEFIWE